ncbi:MAG: amino acid synthesis family protein [Bosea sp.]|nr:amino acid synthesis family protein [Bosea sp. (in: a-proteobacteria)]
MTLSSLPGLSIRRQFVFAETTFAEMGQAGEPPLRKVAVVAVIANPYAGRYEADLGAFVVESYGKGAVIGLTGEQDHGIALITTPFGDALRRGVGGGRAWISSFSKRAAPGAVIDVPLAHKDALYVRSHYDGVTVHLPDAPLPDEVAIIAAFANRGRLNHRLGGLDAASIGGEDGLT